MIEIKNAAILGSEAMFFIRELIVQARVQGSS